jgi:hypothetical protein
VRIRCFENNVERRKCYEKQSQCQYHANRITHNGPPESLGMNFGNGMGETKADIELLKVK